MKRARAMIRAHLRRFLGGASAAPSETSPQDAVRAAGRRGAGGPPSEASIQKPARAKPALEVGHRTLAGAISDPLLALDVGVFHFRAPALPAQRILGEGVGRGAKPPSE